MIAEHGIERHGQAGRVVHLLEEFFPVPIIHAVEIDVEIVAQRQHGIEFDLVALDVGGHRRCHRGLRRRVCAPVADGEEIDLVRRVDGDG